MICKIRYFRDDAIVAEIPWDDAKGDPRLAAKDGLTLHNATLAIVMNDGGKEIARVRRNS
jgi:hypothetical protein